jgi:hypothetical protein
VFLVARQSQQLWQRGGRISLCHAATREARQAMPLNFEVRPTETLRLSFKASLRYRS